MSDDGSEDAEEMQRGNARRKKKKIHLRRHNIVFFSNSLRELFFPFSSAIWRYSKKKIAEKKRLEIHF